MNLESQVMEMKNRISELQKELKAKRRLKNINTHEVSLVDRAANGHGFLIYKNLEEGGGNQMEGDVTKMEAKKSPNLTDSFSAIEKKGDESNALFALSEVAKVIESGNGAMLGTEDLTKMRKDSVTWEELKQRKIDEGVIKIDTPSTPTKAVTVKADNTQDAPIQSQQPVDRDAALIGLLNKLVDRVEALEKIQPLRKGMSANQEDRGDRPVDEIKKGLKMISDSYRQGQTGNPGIMIAKSVLGGSAESGKTTTW